MRPHSKVRIPHLGDSVQKFENFEIFRLVRLPKTRPHPPNPTQRPIGSSSATKREPERFPFSRPQAIEQFEPLAHPSTEHLDPLFFALGARRESDRVVDLFEGFQYGTLSMRSFVLGGSLAASV